MIWNVKILLAKIKDCKGKELSFTAKKTLSAKNPPKIPLNNGVLLLPVGIILPTNQVMAGNQMFDNFFSLTRKDRIGIISITILIGLILLFPKFLKTSPSKNQPADNVNWISELNQLEIKQHQNEQELPENPVSIYQFDKSSSSSKSELFFFDPNSTSTEDWQKLGLRDKTITTIQKYLSKGGSFKQGEDLKKVYGLRNDEYERLAPFIRITEKKNVPANNIKTETNYPGNKRYYSIIDINTADTSAFISLPGIGSKLAARIVNFREKLGGFHSIEQIGETYGLPDSVFQKIRSYLKLENFSLRKININTATVDELKAHPYIQWNIANAIVAYRNQHGLYTAMEDVRKIMTITDEVYSKVSLYLTVQ
jgi:competence ComEA-like helix-hairpin-helix protein